MPRWRSSVPNVRPPSSQEDPIRAALYVGEEKLSIESVNIADPGPGQVRVRVHHCGICHSDQTVIDSGMSQQPMILGHEASGIVDAIGPHVSELTPGDKVVLTPIASCGRCYWCTRGQPGGCVNNQNLFSATFGDGSTGLSRGEQLVYRGMNVGGFAEYAMAATAGAIKVPDDTPLEIACLIGCAVQTGVGAVLNTADVRSGDTVLVLGAGGIGQCVTQGARVTGAGRIIVSDPNGERRAMAMQSGATDVIDPTEVDVVQAVTELTDGIGADTAFEAAGVGALQIVAINATRPGGTTVLVGVPPVEHDLTIPNALSGAWPRSDSSAASWAARTHDRDIPRFLALWRAGQLDLESMITAHRPLDDVNAGMADLREGVGLRTVIDL